MQPDAAILIIHLQLCNLQLATHNCTLCTCTFDVTSRAMDLKLSYL